MRLILYFWYIPISAMCKKGTKKNTRFSVILDWNALNYKETLNCVHFETHLINIWTKKHICCICANLGLQKYGTKIFRVLSIIYWKERNNNNTSREFWLFEKLIFINISFFSGKLRQCWKCLLLQYDKTLSANNFHFSNAKVHKLCFDQIFTRN